MVRFNLGYGNGSDSIIFQVFSKNGDAQVGRIAKQWTGLVKEMFTDADNFGVVFPMDLDTKIKAVTMAATFLIVSLSDSIHRFVLACSNILLVHSQNSYCTLFLHVF